MWGDNMIPQLNMSKIYRGNGTNGSSVPRQPGNRQISPRTPLGASSMADPSLPSSSRLTRRAMEIAPLIEMNPLQCQSVGELQRKLIETAELVSHLKRWYVAQLLERDEWYSTRVRALEDALSGSSGFVPPRSPTIPPRSSIAAALLDHVAPSTIPVSRVGVSGVSTTSRNEDHASTSEDTGRTPASSAAPKRSAVVPVTQHQRTPSAGSSHRHHHHRLNGYRSPRGGSSPVLDRGEAGATTPSRAADGGDLAQHHHIPPRSHSATNAAVARRVVNRGNTGIRASESIGVSSRAAESAPQRNVLRAHNGTSGKMTPTNSGRRTYYTSSPRPVSTQNPTSSSLHLANDGTPGGESLSASQPSPVRLQPRYVLSGSDRGGGSGRDASNTLRLLAISGRQKHGHGR